MPGCSFDTEATLAKARRLIELYERPGIGRERILIKIATTWEGIQAAEQLEQEGIHCNLTLLFSFAQAVACAEAGVTLISPFVGRIYDWYKKERGGKDDSRRRGSRRAFGYANLQLLQEVRLQDRRSWARASARSDQIIRAGGLRPADDQPRPAWRDGRRPRAPFLGSLMSRRPKRPTSRRSISNEKTFRWMHNEDAMATEKLAEGIRKFYADARKLEQYALARVSQTVGSR